MQIIKSVLCNFAVIRVLPFLNNPKDLDPSYKMDLDFWDCFGRKKHHLVSEEIRYYILGETSNAKSELVLLEWTPCLCLRYDTCQHFYHCHVRCHELFVAYAKFGCILYNKTE